MAYAAFSVVFGEQPSAAKWNILGTNDAGFDTYIGNGTNAIQQVQITNYSSVATGATIMVIDDTIPQITEGDQYMTQAITPKSATNLLIFEIDILGSCSNASNLAAALFQDSTANALAGAIFNMQAVTTVNKMSFSYSMTAGTTSSTTFRVRAGGQSGTFTFNGSAGARLFGAIPKSTIKITEYKV